jgi:hypothetical protein
METNTPIITNNTIPQISTNSCATKPIIYNNNDLASDTIDTIILSGGGYLGILYFGLIKLLDTENLYSGIKRVYGVSVGSIFALLIILKYKYSDAIRLLETDFDVGKFITVNSKDIFNLPETFGLTEPVYIEQCVKAVLEKADMSPYITMEDLYTHTGIEFNLGVTLAMQNKYQLINHITRPELPVWLAIRMSANLPIIFNPVRDLVFNDLVYDGGHLNNNPIKCYLESAYKPVLCDAYTQTDKPVNINDTVYPGIESPDQCKDIASTPSISVGGSQPLKKYKMNFICIDLKINRMQSLSEPLELDKISLMDYLVAIISKFTYNQDSYKSKYQQYLLNIDCSQFPELAQIPFTASNEKIKEICEQGYEIIYTYYNDLLN